MSSFSNRDNQSSVPKFSKERTVRPTVKLVANAATSVLSSNTILNFDSTTGVANGQYVSGNNINVGSSVQGFFHGNVTVVNFTSNTVTLSKAVTANVSVGDAFYFDSSIDSSSDNSDTYYDKTFLVSPTRLANVGTTAEATHVGWNYVTQGQGPVTNISVSNPTAYTYTNAYLSFAGTNTSRANGQIVTANGNVISVLLNSGGLYNAAPTVTASGANNANLQFVVTVGGRCGRIQSETLVALSNTIVSNDSSGGSYFPGA
jgi:hypothetical protein